MSLYTHNSNINTRSRINCAISGLSFSVEHFQIAIPHTQGYFHPIFAATYSQLYSCYDSHCKGNLTPTESYLTFLAFLHNTHQIEWQHPATLNPSHPSTIKLVANNIAQLLEVIEKTACIKHPSFMQPSFKVTYANSSLLEIPNWIVAWSDNIYSFYSKRATDIEIQDAQKIENRLSYLILSGVEPAKYTDVIADWASDASGGFPEEKEELYKKTIRACFNIDKMFNTPLPLLKEIKDYCECNIDVGSIHFHTLLAVLTEGISRHIDYLGGSSLSLGYTLLTSSESSLSKETELKNRAELETIAASAPSEAPIASDYQSSLAFLKAKLAYAVASAKPQSRDINDSNSSNPDNTNTNSL